MENRVRVCAREGKNARERERERVEMNISRRYGEKVENFSIKINY